MKKATIFLGILSLAVIAGCTIFEEPTAAPADTQTPALTEGSATAELTPTATTGTNTNATTTTQTIQEFTVEAKETSFEPSAITAKVGQPLKLTFLNTGTHTFTIDGFGVNASLTGTSTVVEFTPPQTGAFEFYCGIPGHKDAGMKGTLTITE